MIANGQISIALPMRLPHLPTSLRVRVWASSTLLSIGFLSCLLSNVKMRIYFVLLLE